MPRTSRASAKPRYRRPELDSDILPSSGDSEDSNNTDLSDSGGGDDGGNVYGDGSSSGGSTGNNTDRRAAERIASEELQLLDEARYSPRNPPHLPPAHGRQFADLQLPDSDLDSDLDSDSPGLFLPLSSPPFQSATGDSKYHRCCVEHRDGTNNDEKRDEDEEDSESGGSYYSSPEPYVISEDERRGDGEGCGSSNRSSSSEHGSTSTFFTDTLVTPSGYVSRDEHDERDARQRDERYSHESVLNALQPRTRTPNWTSDALVTGTGTDEARNGQSCRPIYSPKLDGFDLRSFLADDDEFDEAVRSFNGLLHDSLDSQSSAFPEGVTTSSAANIDGAIGLSVQQIQQIQVRTMIDTRGLASPAERELSARVARRQQKLFSRMQKDVEEIKEIFKSRETVRSTPFIGVASQELTAARSPTQAKGAVSRFQGTLLQIQDTLPQIQNALPQASGALPQIQDMLPHIPDALPQIQDAVPQRQDILPQVQGALPQTQDAFPQTQNALPQMQDTAPQVPVTLPQIQAEIQVYAEPRPPQTRKQMSHVASQELQERREALRALLRPTYDAPQQNSAMTHSQEAGGLAPEPNTTTSSSQASSQLLGDMLQQSPQARSQLAGDVPQPTPATPNLTPARGQTSLPTPQSVQAGVQTPRTGPHPSQATIQPLGEVPQPPQTQAIFRPLDAIPQPSQAQEQTDLQELLSLQGSAQALAGFPPKATQSQESSGVGSLHHQIGTLQYDVLPSLASTTKTAIHPVGTSTASKGSSASTQQKGRTLPGSFVEDLSQSDDIEDTQPLLAAPSQASGDALRPASSAGSSYASLENQQQTRQQTREQRFLQPPCDKPDRTSAPQLAFQTSELESVSSQPERVRQEKERSETQKSKTLVNSSLQAPVIPSQSFARSGPASATNNSYLLPSYLPRVPRRIPTTRNEQHRGQKVVKLTDGRKPAVPVEPTQQYQADDAQRQAASSQDHSFSDLTPSVSQQRRENDTGSSVQDGRRNSEQDTDGNPGRKPESPAKPEHRICTDRAQKETHASQDSERSSPQQLLQGCGKRRRSWVDDETDQIPPRKTQVIQEEDGYRLRHHYTNRIFEITSKRQGTQRVPSVDGDTSHSRVRAIAGDEGDGSGRRSRAASTAYRLSLLRRKYPRLILAPKTTQPDSNGDFNFAQERLDGLAPCVTPRQIRKRRRSITQHGIEPARVGKADGNDTAQDNGDHAQLQPSPVARRTSTPDEHVISHRPPGYNPECMPDKTDLYDAQKLQERESQNRYNSENDATSDTSSKRPDNGLLSSSGVLDVPDDSASSDDDSEQGTQSPPPDRLPLVEDTVLLPPEDVREEKDIPDVGADKSSRKVNGRLPPSTTVSEISDDSSSNDGERPSPDEQRPAEETVRTLFDDGIPDTDMPDADLRDAKMPDFDFATSKDAYFDSSPQLPEESETSQAGSVLPDNPSPSPTPTFLESSQGRLARIGQRSRPSTLPSDQESDQESDRNGRSLAERSSQARSRLGTHSGQPRHQLRTRPDQSRYQPRTRSGQDDHGQDLPHSQRPTRQTEGHCRGQRLRLIQSQVQRVIRQPSRAVSGEGGFSASQADHQLAMQMSPTLHTRNDQRSAARRRLEARTTANLPRQARVNPQAGSSAQSRRGSYNADVESDAIAEAAIWAQLHAAHGTVFHRRLIMSTARL